MILNVSGWFENLFEKIAEFFQPISDWFWEFSEPVREFLLGNGRNPILWIGLVIVGLIVFEILFRVLHKD